MAIRLRGHHLLCMLGYRGMGYSEAYAANMTAVYEGLRKAPETEVIAVVGPDDLCVCFPADQEYHCENHGVYEKDAFVLKHLGITVGESLPWSEIVKRIAADVKPEDIPRWCSSCPWLSYGVCEAGVGRIREEGALAPLPDKGDARSGACD